MIGGFRGFWGGEEALFQEEIICEIGTQTGDKLYNILKNADCPYTAGGREVIFGQGSRAGTMKISTKRFLRPKPHGEVKVERGGERYD